MGKLAKFRSLTGREKLYLCEASILLSLSNASVKVIAFRHIERFLRAHWNDGIQSGIDHQHEIKLVERSLSRAANVLPWKSRCLSLSIAEFVMLRRRGISAVMYAGVRFFGHSSLEAHAWIDTGLASDKISENSSFATVIKIGKGTADP
jgi:hypothetical protein